MCDIDGVGVLFRLIHSSQVNAVSQKALIARECAPGHMIIISNQHVHSVKAAANKRSLSEPDTDEAPRALSYSFPLEFSIVKYTRISALALPQGAR